MKRKATSHKMFKRWCMIRTYIRNQYPSYQGVTMCPEWDQDFWEFADYIDAHWDLTDLTSKDVFDRIDNTLPYEPGNVRFTDMKGNCRDRKTTHYLTYKGQHRCLSEWSEITGIEFSCLLSRIYRGWPAKKCLGY
jgi:hypothetical protein